MRERLENITARIRGAAVSSGRDPAAIRLVTVSKTQPSERVREAIGAGATILGENYIQEARDKIAALAQEKASWHFIGHLQRNKAKYAVPLFDLIHSVDSLRLAKELDKQARKIDKVQEILVQVNISGEETKSGIDEKGCLELIRSIADLKQVRIRGLMTMPPFFDQPDRARPYFSALRELSERIQAAAIPDVAMPELSMGMTGDFEAAIREGATLVRIGTAIFGERH